MSEKDLGKFLFKQELEKQKYYLKCSENQAPYYSSFKVYVNKTVNTHSKTFRQFWEAEGFDATDIPSPQPEIDLILEDDRGVMRAVELKVIKKGKRCIRPSYYVGIGQTLAYLSFGFPQVALWLCFNGDSLEDKEILEYNSAFEKIVAPLKDFMGTTFFKIHCLEKSFDYFERVVLSRQKDLGLAERHRYTFQRQFLYRLEYE